VSSKAYQVNSKRYCEGEDEDAIVSSSQRRDDASPPTHQGGGFCLLIDLVGSI